MFSPSSYQQEWRLALTAVREAAALCRFLQEEPLAGAEKPDGSPVTAADLAAQALICHTLAGAFPDDPIVAEEDSTLLRAASGAALLEQVTGHVRRCRPGATGSEVCRWIDHGAQRSGWRFWALDPLDGSKGFLRGRQYAIALALVEGGQVKLAAVACPKLRQLERWPHAGLLLAAAAGEGAWALGLDEATTATRLEASTIADPGRASACESFESAHTNHEAGAAVASALGLASPPLRLDSQVKYALVAGGSVEAYLRIPPPAGAPENIWDHAAGSLLVVEAGGRVTDLAGQPFQFAEETIRPGRGIAATNGVFHAALLAAVRAAGLSR